LSKVKKWEAVGNDHCALKKSQDQQVELSTEIQELRLRSCEVSRLSSQVRHIAETFSDCCAEKQQVIEELHNVKDELREMGE